MSSKKLTGKVNYFRRLIDSNDSASSQRFLGLSMSAFLVVCSFVLLFTRVSNANAALLDTAMLYSMIIVLVSILGLKVDKVAEIMLAKSKIVAAAQVLTPQPTATKIENVEGDVTGSNKTDVKIEDDVFENDADLKEIKKNLTNSLKTKE